MASRRNQILAAVLTALSASTKPAAVKLVRRGRMAAIDKALHAAILIYPVVDPVDDRAITPRAYRRLRVRIEMRHYGDPPDEALDPVYVWVVKQMMSDESFGGLAFACHELETAWDQEQKEVLYARAATDFEIRYHSNEKDPEQA